MARLIPEEVAERNHGPWPDSEHATLNRLAVALSAEYTVFHGIHWARIDQAHAVMQAVSSEVIAPSTGGEPLAALGQVAKIREADEVLSRVEALERNAEIHVSR
jgi:hypothetical protein